MSLRDRLAKVLLEWPNAKTQKFAKHPMAAFFKYDLKTEVETIVNQFGSNYLTTPSVGAGNWADVAWLAILDKNITKTPQDGLYPVYLFQPNGTGVFLSLMQGVTSLEERFNKAQAKEYSEHIKSVINKKINLSDDWSSEKLNLNATSDRGKSYEDFTIVAKHYRTDSLPGDITLERDLQEILTAYRKIAPIYLQETQEIMGQTTDIAPHIKPLDTRPLSKPFLLLAGISGTGKSRFVRQQAEATSGSSLDNYCLVSVRPDWHEPSDLLGYTTRLSGTASYVVTDTLKFIVAAWKALMASGLTVSDKNGRSSIQGSRNALDAVAPHWLCLDEMNLAPIEQYFADYLSVIETRRWQWDGDNFAYSCDALLKSGHLQELDAPDQLRDGLGLTSTEYDALWQHFLDDGIGIPFNLLVAGTVNMDETTHGFSRKVIDRALTLDFGEFFPNDFDRFFGGGFTHEMLGYPTLSDARYVPYFSAADPDGKATIEFLKAVNAALTGTPFELAYRALNELLLAVASQRPDNAVELQAVWDDFLLQKVLPRIDGDAEKLQQISENDSLLTTLRGTLETQLAGIWGIDETSATRPDFYRKTAAGPATIACRSRHKLAWMQHRLNDAGFTSFWP